jgi:diadenosine tetraphosphatase ApaH/serine/threonine PP2A family protein phosphatase
MEIESRTFGHFMIGDDLDEVVFQVLLTRMKGKKQYRKGVPEERMLWLCQSIKTSLDTEPALLRLVPGIVIVGDLHGNVDDLIRIFEHLRYPPSTRYLFLGDYVDRGVCGTEVLMLLFALKLKYPQHIYLLRGNHETESLTRFYGFFREITGKYSEAVYRAVISVFSSLPLCAVIGDRVFCVHGGISPLLHSLSEIEQMPKPKDFSLSGVFTDMVWSDTSGAVEKFEPCPRGCGFLFWPAALSEFLKENNLDLLVRSHTMCEEGTWWPFEGNPQSVETCLTVFSTSNYCDEGNSAAVLFVADDLLVNVEEFGPPVPEDPRNKAILLPYWLCDLIAERAADKARARRKPAIGKGRTNENVNVVNAAVQ